MAEVVDPPDALNDEFTYDVAFSFLARDADTARALSRKLMPQLRCFGHDRRSETLLDGDEMDRFARVFTREARLAVILYRDGWGHTPWTAIEETAIKERALTTRFASVAVVQLDSGSDLPAWIPRFMLYVGAHDHTLDEVAAVLRARAREVGATLTPLTAVDLAAHTMQRELSRHRRRDFLQSAEGVALAEAEIGRLGEEIVRLVETIREKAPLFDIRAEAVRRMAYLVSPGVTTTAAWELNRGNTLSGARVEVDDIRGEMVLPSEGGRASRPQVLETTAYVPTLNDALEMRWIERQDRERILEREAFPRDGGMSTDCLADEIVQRHMRRFLKVWRSPD